MDEERQRETQPGAKDDAVCVARSLPAGPLPLPRVGACQRATPSPDICEARVTGLTKDGGSDPDHLGGSTRTLPPLAACGLPPEVESAEGAPHAKKSVVTPFLLPHVLGVLWPIIDL